MISDSQLIADLVMNSVNVKPDLMEIQAGQPVNQVVNQTPQPQSLSLPDEVLTVASTDKLNSTINVDAQTHLSHESDSEKLSISIGGHWSDSNSQLAGNFPFSKMWRAARFISCVLSEASDSKYHRLSLALNSSDDSSDSDWVVTANFKYESEVSDTELLLAHYASYIHLRIGALPSYYDEYYANPTSQNQDELNKLAESLRSDAIKLTQKTEDESFTWVQKLAGQPLGVDSSKRLIKVPFCVLGSWSHPVYETVSFTQNDFDNMKQNFANGEVGFEPPLFLGHPIDTDTMEGHAAEAFLQEIVQEGNVLSGIFETVSDETYAAVALGRYRYSSGEFIRNWQSKSNGKSVGTVLIGVALTNRPFLPNLPRVSALSAPLESRVSLTFQLTNPDLVQPMTTQTSPEKQQEQTSVAASQPVQSPSPTQTQDLSMTTELEQFKNLVNQQFTDLKQSYTQQFEAQKQELAAAIARLTTAEAEKQDLATRLAAAEEKLKATEVNAKLAELEALTLPVEVKEKYSELIKNGTLGEQESVVMETLKQMSLTRVQEATTQHGTVTATQALNDPNVQDPYASVIERNQQLAKAKEKALMSLLS